MLYPVDLFLEIEVQTETEVVQRLARVIDDIEDEEYKYQQLFQEDSDSDCNEYFGRGNAKKGYRENYKRYGPSRVFSKLKDRQRVWDAFIPFTPAQFLNLCDECEPLWMLPRNGGDEVHVRKHPIEGCMFSVLGILKTGMSDLEMEAVSQISHALINIEFEWMLTCLDKVLEPEMSLLRDWEKDTCKGAAKSHPGIIYYLDGCDFAVRVGQNKHLYKTHKKNVKHQRAMRAQILVDS